MKYNLNLPYKTMPFVQPTQSRTITDYRPACRVNWEAKQDARVMNDTEYRLYLQSNAVQARDARVSHVTLQPYFASQPCVMTENPKLENYRRPS